MNPSKYEDRLNDPVIGYLVNTVFSEQLAEKVHAIQKKFEKVFGDAIFYPKNDQLHMTLLDWVTPIREYEKDKDEVYKDIRKPYETAMHETLMQYPPFNVNIETLELFPSCIIIKGTDDGQFNSIRESFVEKVQLPVITRKPPSIIHATIMVFKEVVDLDIANKLLNECSISFSEQTSFFRLIRETKFRLIEYQELQRFYLTGEL